MTNNPTPGEYTQEDHERYAQILANVRGEIRCEHDWVDGACGATAPAGTPGWELRTGKAGDMYWMCPASAAEFPVEGDTGEDGIAENLERQAAARSVRDYLTMIAHNGTLDDDGDQTTLDDGYGADGKIHSLLVDDLRILSGWTK